MVIFKGSQRFFARNAAGKYPLDIAELRTAFTAAGLLADHMRDFRAERLARILANDGPVPLLDRPKIVLHLVPLTAFDPAQVVELGRLDTERRLSPLFAYPDFTRRLNFDGMLMYVRGDDDANLSSLQVFRSGAIESVGVLNRGDGERLIQGEWYEQSLVHAMPVYLEALARLGVEAPLFLMLALVGVRGSTLSVSMGGERLGAEQPIDRDVLVLPEVLLERLDPDVPALMRPFFDAVWNASGRSRSPNYDERGSWAPRGTFEY